MAVSKNTGLYIACPGNYQPSPLGGFLPAHGVPVMLQKAKCRNGALRMQCNLCGHVMFATGDFWERYGLTVDQIRVLFPAGVVNGRGTPL